MPCDDPRAGQQPVGDGIAERHGGGAWRADIAHGGEAGHQGDARMTDALEDGAVGVLEEKATPIPTELRRIRHEVGVQVNQPRHHRVTGEIDHLGAGGDTDPAAHLGNPSVADDDGDVPLDGLGGAVEEGAGLDDGDAGAALCRRLPRKCAQGQRNGRDNGEDSHSWNIGRGAGVRGKRPRGCHPERGPDGARPAPPRLERGSADYADYADGSRCRIGTAGE
jgi:hypothetical protein